MDDAVDPAEEEPAARRLLIVDDHASSRQPLALLLTLALPFDEVLQVGTAAEAFAVAADVDVAVIDLGLPDEDGATLLARMRARNPGLRALVLTANPEQPDAARAVAAGAQAVVHKAADLDEIVAAVQHVASGGTLLTEGQRALATQQAVRAAVVLTPRERDVLEALADGLTDKEIAERLGIGTGTVRTHVGGVYAKLGAHSRVQALTAAIELGLLARG